MGTNTRALLELVQDRMSRAAAEELLRDAGEPRSLETLLDDSTWSTYEQFRGLLEAAARALGMGTLRDLAKSPVLDSAVDQSQTAALVGSPATLFADMCALGASAITPIDCQTGRELGPGQWLLENRLIEGFEPFREYCAFRAGLCALLPKLVGASIGDVTEETCQCDGADACTYRVRWSETDDPVRRADYYRGRYELELEHLATFQRTVRDMASADDLDAVLGRLVESVAHVIDAPVFVLELDGDETTPRRLFWHGVEADAATLLAGEIRSGRGIGAEGCYSVTVASPHAHYGVLAAVADRLLLPRERSQLDAYAGLAATTLDAAYGLAEAHRQAAGARALLDLSHALSHIATTDEVAANLARAVPSVIGSDHASVVLVDPSGTRARVAGISGVSREAVAAVVDVEYTVHESKDIRYFALAVPEPSVPEASDRGDHVAHEAMASVGTVATVIVPIPGERGVLGWISTSVAERPERLRARPELEERLRGIAAQASTALRNAMLLDQVRHQALHDPLTGLPNRALVLERVGAMLDRQRDDASGVAVLFIDLDGFKDINDTLGHAAGDEVLRAAAVRLTGALPPGCTMGRLGGDEFVVLSTFDGDPGDDAGRPGAELLAQELLDVLREPFQIERPVPTTLVLSASIGIAVGARPSADDLLRDADVALYQAKAAGKSCARTFVDAMGAAVRDRLALDADLRSALDHGEFFLVYQPMFDLRDERVTGTEALLRWRRPDCGVVPPVAFIPALEETGLIVDVGRWVLDEACRQTAAWRRRGLDLDVSVNVSARQFDDDSLVDDVRGALGRSGLPARALTIEITETTIMSSAVDIPRRLAEIKALGVRVAIDDFGTGYSSLAYLAQFPVDTLKIDRSFVAGMTDPTRSDAQADALIGVLVKLGRSLGLETLAEGIEEPEQLRRLQHEGCDSGQGFLWARPLEPDALAQFVLDGGRAGVGDRAALPAPTPVA
jgi:diguanylate cyclase (GGDEF)-like protein